MNVPTLKSRKETRQQRSSNPTGSPPGLVKPKALKRPKPAKAKPKACRTDRSTVAKTSKRPNRMRHNAKDDLLDLSSGLVRSLRKAVRVSADDHGKGPHWTDEFKAAQLMIEAEIERTYGPLPGQIRELTALVDDWRDRHGVVSEWTVYALLHLGIRYSCAAPNALEALLPFNLAIVKQTRQIKRAKERIDDHWATASGITTPLPWP